MPPTNWWPISSAPASWCNRSSRSRSTAATPIGASSTCGKSTDQIIASLRPVLKKSQIALTVDVPTGIVMDSYPGSYGQVLTNLFLNARRPCLSRRPRRQRHRRGAAGRRDDVEIIVADDGVGMTDEVQRRAFDPFFTTRRSEGGTGLGLHIIFNLVTQQLGGRLTLRIAARAGAHGFRITFRGSRPANRQPTQAAQQRIKRMADTTTSST